MAGVTNQLSETAYLVAESRARAVAISRDVYAAHWIPDRLRESVRRLWEEFAANVYPHDDVVLGVRNRFFLDRLSVFAADGPTIFVNVAAGFTSYPFLIEHAIRTIEIDLPVVVDVKSARVAALQDAGVLLLRPLRQIAADLNAASTASASDQRSPPVDRALVRSARGHQLPPAAGLMRARGAG